MFASHPRPGVAALIVRTMKPRSRINSAATALLSSLFLCIANAPAADAPENLAVTPCLHLCVKVGITPCPISVRSAPMMLTLLCQRNCMIRSLPGHSTHRTRRYFPSSIDIGSLRGSPREICVERRASPMALAIMDPGPTTSGLTMQRKPFTV